MAPHYDKSTISEARRLRADGMTYTEIKMRIGKEVPRSTISGWCDGVVLPLWYREKIEAINTASLAKMHRYAMAQHQHQREKLEEQVREEVSRILHSSGLNVLKPALAMLYLGEGGKRAGSGLSLGNSDPKVIELYIHLLRRCYGISTAQLHCRVGYRADQNIRELEEYWSQRTGIPLAHFYKTRPDPRTVGKATKNSEYRGVCVISCAGARIKLELKMLSDALLSSITSDGPERRGNMLADMEEIAASGPVAQR